MSQNPERLHIKLILGKRKWRHTGVNNKPEGIKLRSRSETRSSGVLTAKATFPRTVKLGGWGCVWVTVWNLGCSPKSWSLDWHYWEVVTPLISEV